MKAIDFDAESAADAAQDLTDWLELARRNAIELAESLDRAYKVACEHESLLAMLLLPELKIAHEQQRKIELLIAARGK